MKKIHCSSLFSFSLLTILLFSVSPSLAEDTGFYLEEWEIRKGGPDVINVQDFPAELLPEGLDSLDLLVVGEPTDGPELALIGYGEDTQYLGSTSFGMFMNPVKTCSWFDEEEDIVVVASQYPYSMSTNIVSYIWNPETLILVPVDSVNEDYSTDQLLLVDSLLEAGEIGLAAETLDNVMYPSRYYYNEEMSCKFLIAAHDASMAAFQEGNIQDAVQYYEAARSVLERTTGIMDWCNAFESGEHFQETQFSWYIDKDELQSILSDYAIIFKNEDQIMAGAFSWCAAVLGGN
ncbi:MAG: hypothetical protein KAW14_00590 [Candidatus Aegiribacteria sp.]|nr:hypothetical protein [Candidatus Aegiribacteria sp.]